MQTIVQYLEPIKDFVGLCCGIYLAVEAHPIQVLKAKTGFTPDSNNKVVSYLAMMFDCCLCLGFWVGLVFYMDILTASIVSICSEFLYRKLS